MLLDEEVTVNWNSTTRKRYESFGHVFIKIGDKFVIPVEQLTDKSTVRVDLKCTNCGTEYSIRWGKYLSKLHKGKCANCVNKRGTEYVSHQQFTELFMLSTKRTSQNKISGPLHKTIHK